MSSYSELPGELRETVARAIHERYRQNQADRKPSNDPAMGDWDDLPEHLRESNRAQADDIFRKLHVRGYTVHEVRNREIVLREFPPDELEEMSEEEHDRWWRERRADGWRLGERNVLSKTHPDLVSWGELSEEVREWDREAVRAIPELLASVGLEIRRGPQ